MQSKTQILFSLLSLGVLILSFGGCQSDAIGPETGRPGSGLSPIPLREDVEADKLALLFSGEIIAPQALYLTISADLKTLRFNIPDSLSFLRDIEFTPRDAFDMVQLSMDSVGRQWFRDGKYTAWDSLNTYFGLTFLDTFVLPAWERFNESMYVTFRSAHRFNPYLVSEKYDTLEGVESAFTVGLGGDSPSLYFGVFDNRKFFLIRDAWGDCPSGCIHARFYLFRNRNNSYKLDESWPPGDEEGVPQWLIDAKRGILLNYETSDLRGTPWELRTIPGPP